MSPPRTTRIQIDDLVVRAGSEPLLRGVSIAVAAGEPFTLIGETGSGKTLVADALMGTLAPELGAEGRVVIGADAFAAADREGRRALWGRRVAMLPQEPWLALDPLMRSADQIAEVHRFLGGADRPAAMAKAHDDLERFGLRRADRRFPFQLSGGMAQRVAFAAATASGASVLIADEPTKGLDAALCTHVGGLLRSIADRGAVLLTITHDMALAASLGGQVAVMLDGEIVEQGPATTVLSHPRHDYTRRLLAADPSAWAPRPPRSRGESILRGEALGLSLGGARLFERLDIEVAAGEWLAISGGSGSGKTSLGNVLLGLRAPDTGRVLRPSHIAGFRYQKVYQDPVASFPPERKLGAALDDVARRHGLPGRAAGNLLRRLGVAGLMDRLPAQVSGGELQRVALARVLMLRPCFLFADEPTSRLDPISQQDTVAVVHEACLDAGCAVLLVTHDQALARATADRVVTLGAAAAAAEPAREAVPA